MITKKITFNPPIEYDLVFSQIECKTARVNYEKYNKTGFVELTEDKNNILIFITKMNKLPFYIENSNLHLEVSYFDKDLIKSVATEKIKKSGINLTKKDILKKFKKNIKNFILVINLMKSNKVIDHVKLKVKIV